MGSLTGAVASQNVTEAFKGHLVPDGNRDESVKVYGGLTARLASRAETKVGLNDLLRTSGSRSTQRIKVTPGITG